MKTSIKTLLFCTIATLLFSTQFIYTQENENDENNDSVSRNRRFWEATLPSGEYIVALDRISAVSKHSYVVGKSFIVHEVNVQTLGSGLVRFYTFDTIGSDSQLNIAKNLADRGKNLLSTGGKRAGVDITTMVEKEYPLTTHSKTIEYKLFNNDDLEQLFRSLKRAWRENRGRKFSIK